MPSDLVNLKPPTRDEAISLMMRRSPEMARGFEGTTIGQQVAKGLYRPEKAAELRAEFDKRREAQIANALWLLNGDYEQQLERKRQIERHNAAALAAEILPLRERYMEQPGATAEGFEKALPELLEAKRRQAALEGQTQVEEMMEKMRGSISL